mmetsp:Transcript_13181/g.25603  ORF Transcript_13181/g.25603 Transcript_13181/m.25603 type:complete len:471 (+) Transcript_13181:241-1653(+)
MQLVGDRIYNAVVHRGGSKRFHDTTEEVQNQKREHRWLRNLQKKVQPPKVTSQPKVEKTAASSDFSLMTATCTAARVLSMGSADCTLPALSASAVLAFTLICSLWLSLRFLRRNWSRSSKTPPSSPAGEKMVFEPVELGQRSTVEALPRVMQLVTEVSDVAKAAADVNKAEEFASEDATEEAVVHAVEQLAEDGAGEALKSGLSPVVASITEDVSEAVSETARDDTVNTESAECREDVADTKDVVALATSSMVESAVRAVVKGALRDAEAEPAAGVDEERQGSSISSIDLEPRDEVKDACNVTSKYLAPYEETATRDTASPGVAFIHPAAANAKPEDDPSEEKTPEQNVPGQKARENKSTNEVSIDKVVGSQAVGKSEKFALPKEILVPLNPAVALPTDESAGGHELDESCDAADTCAGGPRIGSLLDHTYEKKISRDSFKVPNRRATTTTLAFASVAALALVFARARYS